MFAPSTPLDWQGYGACNEVDPDTMFPEPRDVRGIEAAQAVCADCPVRTTCLTWAVETDQTHGVWGGVDEETRRREKRAAQRRAARQRAREAADAGVAA